jgi:hypothetical protein
MNGNDGKSKKDNSGASPESSTNVSSKLREEKEGQQTGGEKSVTMLSTDAASVLDEAKENVVNAAEEARRQIPRYTETMRSYQEQIIQSAHEIAENYINVQKQIINSMQSSFLPYWENFYGFFGNGWWISPSRMIEAYANIVSSFAGNTLRTTQLVNNTMLANMDAFKKTVDQARESSNDLARACMNIAKKIERDSLDVPDNNVLVQGSTAENVKTLKMRKTE